MSGSVRSFYVDFIPRDLFRNGTATKSKLTNLRTAPPRDLTEKYDIEVYNHEIHGNLWVKSDTGGISVFDKINPFLKSIFWYKLPKGAKIPDGLRITRDGDPHPHRPVHYTIRPIQNMPLTRYIQLLEDLASSAVPTFERPAQQKRG